MVHEIGQPKSERPMFPGDHRVAYSAGWPRRGDHAESTLSALF
jgi:hypothetical protein